MNELFDLRQLLNCGEGRKKEEEEEILRPQTRT